MPQEAYDASLNTCTRSEKMENIKTIFLFYDINSASCWPDIIMHVNHEYDGNDNLR